MAQRLWARLRDVAQRLVVEPEFVPLSLSLAALALAAGFFEVAEAVAEGEAASLDVWVLRAVRRHAVPTLSSAAGQVALNLTALGSTPVLTLVVVCVAGFLLLTRMPGRALYVVVAAIGGGLLQGLLKRWFTRPRPFEVAPLLATASFSFPSGHAMGSAAVYLALGALLAASARRRRVKLYVLTVAFLLTGIVGVTRVLLGVHYPTDVLAGWLGGLTWALVCWVPFEVFRIVRGGRPASPGPPSR